jgi:hypothetical protein
MKMSREIKCKGVHGGSVYDVAAVYFIPRDGYALPTAKLEKGDNVLLIVPLREVELLQYIGLKDICDKEACKDDIIKFDDTGIGELKGRGRIICCTNLLLVPAPGWYIETKEKMIIKKFPVCFQIIGNYLENPELLAE